MSIVDDAKKEAKYIEAHSPRAECRDWIDISPSAVEGKGENYKVKCPKCGRMVKVFDPTNGFRGLTVSYGRDW